MSVLDPIPTNHLVVYVDKDAVAWVMKTEDGEEKLIKKQDSQVPGSMSGHQSEERFRQIRAKQIGKHEDYVCSMTPRVVTVAEHHGYRVEGIAVVGTGFFKNEIFERLPEHVDLPVIHQSVARDVDGYLFKQF